MFDTDYQLESLIFESYTNVSSRVYYCNSNMGFKIFDSHVRDLYGRGQSKGTCVVLEVLSPDS